MVSFCTYPIADGGVEGDEGEGRRDQAQANGEAEEQIKDRQTWEEEGVGFDLRCMSNEE